MYLEKYNKWLNHPQMDQDLLDELKQMNDKQKEDAFYTDAKFGTAGMRNLLGAGSNRLNVYTIRKATLGFGNYLLKKNVHAKVAIAYDNRYKSTEFAFSSAKVLASLGIESYVYDTLRTTPQLSFTVRYLGCDGGIMITASHNTKEYNGYKVYDETGCQLVPQLVQGVIDEITALGDEFVEEPILTAAQEQLIHHIGQEIDEVYLNEVLKIQLNPQLDKKGIKFVYTPQHGTSYKSLQYLFDKVGYDVVYVKEQCTPDPAFSNTLIPNPEDPKAYNLAIEYAQRENADMVLTTDPDGDRLGVACKDGDKYTLMTGNQTGSVLIEYIFSQLREKGLMPKNPVMFNTVVTSDLGEVIANDYGIETEKTLTGFKYIGNKIHNYEQNHEKSFVFGYEESYGYLISDIVRDKDANQSCLLIAEAANYYKKKGLSFLDVLHNLYKKYGTYLETQQSKMFEGADGANKMNQMLDKLKNNIPSEFAGTKVVKYQDFANQFTLENGVKSPLLGHDVSDVFKYFLEDGSWIAIRPSGTEPKCKAYYCIKGNSQEDVEAKKTKYYAVVEQLMA